MFRRIGSFLKSALGRADFEAEMDAELRDHMRAYADDLILWGVAREEAELRARREIGAAQSIKDQCRDSIGLNLPDALARDFRYAFRVLRKGPGFTVTAFATLGLCIGANTAIFSVVDAVLFRPLPYPEPGRLAMVSTLQRDAQGESEDTSVYGSSWEYLHDRARMLDLAWFGTVSGVNLAPPGSLAQYVQQARVSAGFFRVLGVSPLIGREIQPEEDRPGGPAVAVLSYALWSRAFASDPSIVGKKVILRGEPYTITGVMPKGFQSTPPAEIWTPLRPSATGEGGGSNYGLLARIRPGYRWQDAGSEIATLGAPYLAELKNRGYLRLHLIPVLRGLADELQRPLLLLWAAVGLVLLIGCVNIAALMLARSGARRHEIATRLALGSGRGAIVRQLLTESFLIACAGGAAGLALGYAAVAACRNLVVSALFADRFTGGLVQPISMSGRVLAATAITALLTTLLFGLYPAFETTRVDLRAGLAASGRAVSSRRGWSRRALVVCEVALGMVLLVGAGLVVRTFVYLTNLNPGYDGRKVLTASLSLQDARYNTGAAVNRLFDESLTRIRAYPGVEAAGVGLTLPYERALNDGVRVVDGSHPMQRPNITNVTYVTPGYFEALHMNLLRGRKFDDRDTSGAEPAAIVNEAFVRRYLRDPEPVGRHLAFGATVVDIVGVVADVQARAGSGGFGPIGPVPGVYVPAAQFAGFNLVHVWFNPKWVVRASGRQAEIAAAMRQAVSSIDPQLPFAEFRGMDQVRGAAFGLPGLEAILFGALAVLALVLAAIGIYGLIAHSVVERTREFGIRLALGSTVSRAIVTVARPGIVLAAIGIAAGWVLSRGAGKLIRSVIWGVKPDDPLTFAVIAGTLLSAAVLAAFIPALRIARIDPARALREE
jgi:predicted permease